MTLMFQPQFEPLILSGRKPHTIRPKRKISLKVGQPLSLRVWTGLPYRSPQREFHSANVQKVCAIRIDSVDIVIDGTILPPLLQDEMAWHDGFADAAALRDWFTRNHGLPFEGELIYWRCV